MAQVTLSQRLQTLADMVTPGNRVADVGCDHGFVSIYLVQKEISPKVLAMDVRTGPLSRAKEHIAEYKLTDYIEVRLSDGLQEYEPGEADTLICAGMGGKLMTRILTESRQKAQGLRELILQPQSEIPAFRRFLRAEGYQLLDENIVYEEGKYYFFMKVCFRGDSVRQQELEEKEAAGLYESFGELLLKRRNPILKQYLLDTLLSRGQIADTLRANVESMDKEKARVRLQELEQEVAALKRALALYE